VPKLDHAHPLFQVIVEKLGEQYGAVLAAGERKPADNQPPTPAASSLQRLRHDNPLQQLPPLVVPWSP
jgi:hypothetical protein